MPTNSNRSAYLRRLSDALEFAVSEGQIGLPRFIRWFDRFGDPEAVAHGIDICSRVFGSHPVRQDRAGDALSNLAVTAVWANGASALVSIGMDGEGLQSGPEVMLLGSSGAVYFDGVNDGAATVERIDS